MTKPCYFSLLYKRYNYNINKRCRWWRNNIVLIMKSYFFLFSNSVSKICFEMCDKRYKLLSACVNACFKINAWESREISDTWQAWVFCQPSSMHCLQSTFTKVKTESPQQGSNVVVHSGTLRQSNRYANQLVVTMMDSWYLWISRSLITSILVNSLVQTSNHSPKSPDRDMHASRTYGNSPSN